MRTNEGVADTIDRADELHHELVRGTLVQLDGPGDLRQAGLIRSQRGVEGGYWLAQPAEEITLAEVIRAVDGPLANVRGVRPENLEYAGSSLPLRDVWVAVRASLRSVLEAVTLADVAAGELPAVVRDLVADPEAWAPHP